MCNYVNHVRSCYLCASEETVLISEKSCSEARKTGRFGSCGKGVGNKPYRTQYRCWKCSARMDGHSYVQGGEVAWV
ncbi:uncharacterized protein B0I36DRAFT_324974 [Microdochium trichocladiopsis]|uniref:Uncharacterized protein n=1 Tax=Microdochium trichocladiopsis TaxID=1682393 RepID=A0A9P8Y6I6_9PEZI|nr:uncharacterized protein B0I36DRAFT_324974 [Microdochium trichocladiopsis]KAH7029061.1 hypothetical protein B0I36DRAFT_324974 [Microdochium trichocladiopsis]